MNATEAPKIVRGSEWIGATFRIVWVRSVVAGFVRYSYKGRPAREMTIERFLACFEPISSEGTPQ